MKNKKEKEKEEEEGESSKVPVFYWYMAVFLTVTRSLNKHLLSVYRAPATDYFRCPGHAVTKQRSLPCSDSILMVEDRG